MSETLCHCGRPLHYTDAKLKARIERLVRENGSNVLVKTPAGAWFVQRHYIALHGIKAEELPGLGFEKFDPFGDM